MIADIEMPCLCSMCGEWFDLSDGNGCRICNQVFCSDCVEPLGICDRCNELENGSEE